MQRSAPFFRDPAIEAAASAWIVRRDAGLTPAEERAFAAWQVADPRHAAVLAWLDETWGALDRPRRAGKADALLARFAASAAGRCERRRRRRIGGAVGAGALLAAFALIQPWREPAVAIAPEEPALSSNPRVAVMAPERRTLADGSVVELRAGAEIAVEFSAAVRRVALRSGEALFQVAKNPERPFVVAAGPVEVRAVGTAFSVGRTAEDVDVLVTEGKVRVGASQPESVAAAKPATPTPTPAADPAPARGEDAEELFLEARQRVTMPFAARGTALPPVTTMDAAELASRLAWRSTRLEFSDTPLREAIAWMNEHAAGSRKLRLAIDDPALERMPVTGLFRADNTETFVRLLETSLGVKGHRAGDTITLRRQ